MVNQPIIHLSSRSPAPGADDGAYKQYVRWANEVYGPMQIKVPELTGNDSYEIVKENPEYGTRASVSHRKNLAGWEASMESSETKAIVGDSSYGENAV